jgi:hypothetical protein
VISQPEDNSFDSGYAFDSGPLAFVTEVPMQYWRRRFLLLYMMRIPLLFMAVIGFLLPWGFTTSMFHGVADLSYPQLTLAAFLACILINSAISSCFLVLLYGEERADGWAERPKPQERISPWAVTSLYVYGATCYISFLFWICRFMSTAGRVKDVTAPRFFFWSLSGWIAGVLLTGTFFLAVLRFAKPNDDDALEAYAFPVFYVIRQFFGDSWIRSFKKGTRSQAAPGSFAAHDGRFSRLLGSILGPGFASSPASEHPNRIHSGFRTATIFLIVFLIAYWASGKSTFYQLKDLRPWAQHDVPNTVLNFLLLLLIFWSSLLSGLTFFLDRFRVPALVVLGLILYLIAQPGSSDHYFYTFHRPASSSLLKPTQIFQDALDPVIVVTAAGGGIQSAAWTSRVLCGLRADFRPTANSSTNQFESNVLIISAVSGGSVGTMFYLRCLEAPQGDSSPGDWAENSSLEAVAWGLTHPDLQRIFFPWAPRSWRADRGWALERALIKSAQFQSPERLALTADNLRHPILLLNSTDAQTGDPVVFTNSDFAYHPPDPDPAKPPKHNIHNFRDTAGDQIDVFLETAVRMSAAFPYVSPEARPAPPASINAVHLGDGGYFDNSGVFALSQWLKEGVQGQTRKKRILFLELDAFPDSADQDAQTLKRWYYQVSSPLETMLKVRSEAQVVRDKFSGEDLQTLLNESGFQTTWLLVRYEPPTSKDDSSTNNPPLSWHLTTTEQNSIRDAWNRAAPTVKEKVSDFLKGSPTDLAAGVCDPYGPVVDPNGHVVNGVFQRRCAAASAPADSRLNGSR